MKNKTTKSGFNHELNIFEILQLSDRFSDDMLLNGFNNIYNYTDLKRIAENVDKFLINQGDGIYLIKNYPLFNYVHESIEFCIRIVEAGQITDCYIECKFADVNGTAYQKMGYYFNEHDIINHRNSNSYMILVYDGEQFQGDTKSVLQVDNIKNNYIKYNYRQLILDINEFENLFVEKLKNSINLSKIFLELKNLN